MSKLTGHLDNLTALLSSPDLDVSLAAMDILNAISLPTILSMPCVFKLCHAAAAHLFRIFRAVGKTYCVQNFSRVYCFGETPLFSRSINDPLC